MNRVWKSQLQSMTDDEIYELFETNSDVEFDTDGEDNFDDEVDDLQIVFGKNLLIGEENGPNVIISPHDETQIAVGHALENDTAPVQCMEIDTDTQPSLCETVGFCELFLHDDET